MTEIINYLLNLLKILGLAFVDVSLIWLMANLLINIANNIFKGGRNP